MPISVHDVAEFVGGRVVGDAAAVVTGVASVASARVGELVFVEETGRLERALRCGASTILAGEFAAAATGKALVIVEHPRLAFARVAAWIGSGRSRESGVHASAVVH